MTMLQERIDEQTRLLALLVGQVGRSGDGTLALDAGTLAVVDRLFGGLEELRQAAADEPTAPDPGALAAARRAAYVALVGRIRERVGTVVPPGSRVAVITRGDAMLLELPEVAAEHLPRDETGTWAGFHPRDGADAAAHLEAARRRGVTHLVVPEPSAWWLEYYGDLRAALDTTARVLVADEDATIFELAGTVGGHEEVGTTRYRAHVERFLGLVTLLLPAGVAVAVVTRGDDAWLGDGDLDLRHFPSDARGVYMGHPTDDGDAIAALRRAVHHGAGYLAIPTPMAWWAQIYPRFAEHLRQAHRCIVEQAEVGAVFQLLEARPR